MNEIYRAQVDLLLRCLPEVGREDCFALKAINLFVRDMPRLSVDIDLTYVSGATVKYLNNQELSPSKLEVHSSAIRPAS